jgi:hypothetical protein
MILEVAISLIFVFLLFSLVCSALSEILAWFLNLRARTLRSGIETLLKDESFTKLLQQNPKLAGMFQKGADRAKGLEQNVATTLYAHPLIQAMMNDQRHPSYIPKHIFSAAFLDLLHSVAPEAPPPAVDAGKKEDSLSEAMRRLRDAIESLPEESEVRRQLRAVLDDTVTNVQEARARVERWFDDSMQRVAGWYKRRAQIIVFIAATVLVVVSNADSVLIVQSLAHDSTLRAALMTAAQESVKAGAPETRDEPDAAKALLQLQQAQAQLENLRLPIGWKLDPQAKIGDLPDPRRTPQGWGDWLLKLTGLLFTILAVSMGAPFWFDLLNKVVNARLTGAQPTEEPSKKEKKKKRQQD